MRATVPPLLFLKVPVRFITLLRVTAPAGETVKRFVPVELEIVRRFAVWFVTPMIFKVVEAICDPWRKTSEVEVATDATAKLEPFTTSVPIVELGVRNSVDDATPVGSMVKKLMPVEELMVRRFAVWFVAPRILSVVDPTLVPWRKTREVEVAADAIEKFDPEKRNCEVDEVKVMN